MSKLHLAIASLASCLAASAVSAEPLFPNSVVSNDIDFIASSDLAMPGCLSYEGTRTQGMPGGPTEELMASGVHIFAAAFKDGTRVGIWVHPFVGDEAEAEGMAALLVEPLGRLPAIMRGRLSHVVVHSGDRTAFAEHLSHFFVVYDGNVLDRISTNDLEETVFHESVHATLDAEWARSAEWRQAQAADGAFVTEYAAEKPEGEDLAGSALFAITYLRRPERLPPEVAQGVEAIMPARLAFFAELFAAPEPDLSRMDPTGGCPAS